MEIDEYKSTKRASEGEKTYIWIAVTEDVAEKALYETQTFFPFAISLFNPIVA